MPTFSRPNADVRTSGWANAKGGVVGLFNSIDEASPANLANFVQTVLPSRPFATAGTLPGEVSRTSYSTAGGTLCTKIVADVTTPTGSYNRVLLIVPNGIDLAQLTPVVEAFHGVGDDEGIILAGGHLGDSGLTDSWLDIGWPVLSFNEGGVSWGNDSARNGFVASWAWLLSWLNCAGPLLYGVSMGALAALNYLLDAKINNLPVLACALNSAASNFGYTYTNSGTLRPAMQTAYGLGSVSSSDPTYIAAVNVDRGGHDPQLLAASAFPVVPFRLYVGNNDTVINKANNSDAFVAKLTGASWAAEVGEVVYTGGHTAPAGFQPADTNAFYQRAISL